MIIHYVSKDYIASLSMTEQEKQRPHIKIPFDHLGLRDEVYYPLPISIGIKRIIEEYFIEVCNDFPSVLEKGNAIRKDIDHALLMLMRPDGLFAVSFAKRAAGLSDNYFLEWIRETTDCKNESDFLTRFDYCGEKLQLKYSVSKTEIVIYLDNGEDKLVIRRFDPRNPEEFKKMCNQALFIADDALCALYQEGLDIMFSEQGVLQNQLYQQLRQAYINLINE